MSKQKSDPKPADAESTGLGRRVEIGEVRDPLLARALTLWNERKGERRFPTREDMTPRVMAPFLRNIVLVRAIDGGKDYEFRIVGDAIVQVQGASFQGLTLTQIDAKLPGYGLALRPIYDQIIKDGVPRAYRGHVAQSPTGRPFSHESVLFPLGREAVDHILVVGAYAYTPDTPR